VPIGSRTGLLDEEVIRRSTNTKQGRQRSVARLSKSKRTTTKRDATEPKENQQKRRYRTKAEPRLHRRFEERHTQIDAESMKIFMKIRGPPTTSQGPAKQ
jgi:hypothetical protein